MSKKTDQTEAAKKIITAISPVLAEALASEEVVFIGVTVVVDNKHSVTFPFFEPAPDTEDEDQQKAFEESRAKSVVLAAIEYSRTAGLLKQKAIEAIEEVS